MGAVSSSLGGAFSNGKRDDVAKTARTRRRVGSFHAPSRALRKMVGGLGAYVRLGRGEAFLATKCHGRGPKVME
jgi:hypothetical protein